MPVHFSDISDAFFFVSMAEQYTHSVLLCKETGEMFYTSEYGDSDELPEDAEDDKKYIEIPHKNDLDLGKALVIRFTSEHIPGELRAVHGIFSRKGAYARFKDLLEQKDLLEAWYQYEETQNESALREWCRENHLEIAV